VTDSKISAAYYAHGHWIFCQTVLRMADR
jgi:hypothetical protein